MRIPTLALLVLAPTLCAQGGPGAGGALPPVPVPANNPITLAKTLLGKALFFEEQLSSTRTTACASCHIFSGGGSDPRSSANDPTNNHPGFDGVSGTADDIGGSPGVPATLESGSYLRDAFFGLQEQITSRRSMTVVNAAFVPRMFWDGRAQGPFRDPLTGAVAAVGPVALEVQAAGPPVSGVEMAHSTEDWAAIAERIESVDPLALADNLPTALDAFILGRSYADLFQLAFGTADVTPVRIIQAIATYERTLISDNTPFDNFLVVGPPAMTPAANRGLQVFNGPGRCVLCHNGPLFSDMGFHNIGVRPALEDSGRQEVTGNATDFGRFKTPHLRNVALRSPYFHTGQFTTLGQVVAFYNRGGDFSVNQDPRIIPLGLNPGQRADLVAFLTQGLTDPNVANEVGAFTRPRLYGESGRRPVLIGAPTPGLGGFEPALKAIEPARIGNDKLTLAMDEFRGGAPLLFASDIAVNPSGFPVFGAAVYLGLSPALQIVALDPAAGVGAGNGFGSHTIDLPYDTGLIGRQFFGQAFALDAGAPAGLSATQAVQFTIF